MYAKKDIFCQDKASLKERHIPVYWTDQIVYVLHSFPLSLSDILKDSAHVCKLMVKNVYALSTLTKKIYMTYMFDINSLEAVFPFTIFFFFFRIRSSQRGKT